ncbi:RRD2 [Candida pseudojiufengensis]|uniref:RRD2 n=1 Tax=Candida pseudojiufengensis TaxID=497109 RepID=UPI002224B23E|nr:RRD2 [Candida pseudojiufengensis]KAI5959472.1 RRD2 [Candida pseudojiufengensis]
MTFIKPIRRVYTQEDLEKWIDSKTYNEILNFIIELQESVLSKPNDFLDTTSNNEIISKLLNLFNEIDKIIDNNPIHPKNNDSRFGKIEFKDFYNELNSKIEDLVTPICSTGIIETSTYLLNSFGDFNRIDYGSGHELNFICFLLSLQKLGVIHKEDYTSIILQIFTKYMSIMRKLQKKYWLEPAGSHGVWGLDDYHFLPFLFGSSQLTNHQYLKPKSIHNDEIIEQFQNQYIYFECIYFLNQIKTTKNNNEKLSLRWHSPMLDDISSAKSWLKIKEGMIKMYKVEVLGKLPIIQHFLFGSLLKCPEGIPEHSDESTNDDGCGHTHQHDVINTWGDCCGIKIPSAIAASESLKLERKQIPFD